MTSIHTLHSRTRRVPLLAALLVGAIGGRAPANTVAAVTCGAWEVVPSPDVDPTTNLLLGVAALRPGAALGVGKAGEQTLAEAGRVSGWQIVPSVNTDVGTNVLNGVTHIPGDSALWAVGTATEGSHSHGLVERWEAGHWTVFPVHGAGYSSNLHAISGTAPDDIWAVGWYQPTRGSASQPLTEHFDGHTWSIVASPSIDGHGNLLYGVVAISPTDAWAVGEDNGGIYLDYLLAEHWDGVAWTIVSIPSPGNGQFESLYAVTAAGSDNVWAVGYYYFSEFVYTAIEHWDGVSWTTVSHPNPDIFFESLYGVASGSATNVWAVGSTSSATLVEHWDGATWTVVSSPNPYASSNGLSAVTVLPTGEAWAVGSGSDEFLGSVHTLVERYCP